MYSRASFRYGLMQGVIFSMHLTNELDLVNFLYKLKYYITNLINKFEYRLTAKWTSNKI